MAQAACSDATLAALISENGVRGASDILGIDRRAVLRRRRRLERKHGVVITPREPTRHDPNAHPAWLELEIPDGIVLIGSDFHAWPSERVSPAWRAFVAFSRRLSPAAVILNGDVIDGATISRHPPINWEGRPKLIGEIEEAKTRLAEVSAPVRVWALGNHDCLDATTECLTKRGWLPYSELRSSDEILSLVDDDNNAVWSAIDEIVTFPYCGPMIRIQKTRMSMLLTPNHRVLLDRLNWRTLQYDLREFREAGSLPHSFNVPVAGYAPGRGVALSDDQIRFAAWFITDGGVNGKSISIYQSKIDTCNEIEALLNRLELRFGHYSRQRSGMEVCGRPLRSPSLVAHQFHLCAEDSRRMLEIVSSKDNLPSWTNDLNDRQFQIFLDTLIAGDGVWDGNVALGKCCILYGKRSILDDIQALSLRYGWRARIVKDNRGDLRLCLTKHPSLRIEKSNVSKETHCGVVWCLRVPHGNFMVRRNGCAFFTGNSRMESRLADVAPEYALIFGVHLKDHFPDWSPCYSACINDDVVVKHRFKGGEHAIYNNVLRSGRSIITSHLHSLDVRSWTDYNGTRYGADTGMLARPYGPQFLYAEDNPRNWRAGFVVLTFRGGMMLRPEVVEVLDEDHVSFRGEVIDV